MISLLLGLVDKNSHALERSYKLTHTCLKVSKAMHNVIFLFQHSIVSLIYNDKPELPTPQALVSVELTVHNNSKFLAAL